MSYAKSILVERSELAEFFDVSDNYINELVNDHGMPKESHNQYKLFDCFKWFVSYKNLLTKEAIDKARSEKPLDVLARKNAELKELQLEEKRKNLIDLNLVMDEWLDELNIIVTKLDGFGIKVAPQIAGKNDIKEIRIIINEEIQKLKEQIANTPLDINKHSKKNE